MTTNLDITPDLVIELHEHPSPKRDAIGIVLGPGGWDVTGWDDARPTSLLAMTAADTDGWTDEDGFTAEAAEALATGEYGEHREPYTIRDEHGNITKPEPGADVRVVTGELRSEWHDPCPRRDWRTAWWFDLGRADLVIDAPATDAEPAAQLYRTASGRWVEYCRGQWHELDQELVATWVYNRGEVEQGAPRPPVVAAALAARALTDALTPPQARQYRDPEGLLVSVPTAEQAEAAEDLVAAAKAISDLLRMDVLPKVKDHRRKAAGTCVVWRGSEAAAATALGISRQTLNALLNQR